MTFSDILVSHILEYQRQNNKLFKLARPDNVITTSWNIAKQFAASGDSDAKLLIDQGEAHYKQFFKWAASDHHSLELLKTSAKYGLHNAGKALIMHGKKHKKV